MNLKTFFLIFFLGFACMRLSAQQFTIGTFNLRYANTVDTGNLWPQRLPVVANLIRFHQFDIFGTQEVLINQLKDLKTALPQYEYYGKGRDDGKQAGEHSSIFFLKDKFNLIDSGDFWLSAHPEVPGKGWDATCCNRICSWVYLQEKGTGKKFYFFNTHFDHRGRIARVESGKLILKKIREIAGNEPVMLTGDLNGGQSSEWYGVLANSGLLTDAYSQVEHPYLNNSSFNNFGKNVSGFEIIDHIFLSKHFVAKRWGVLTDTYHGKYPSDHSPVLADVILMQ
jgi:endonuclease/exonuclease/phosphatase family metal-dependent hydrolase